MFLAKSGIDDNQPITILAAATQQVTTAISSITDQQLLYVVEYELIASVLYQWFHYKDHPLSPWKLQAIFSCIC